MGIQQEKRRKGGCSSFSENLNGPYTLIDNAVVKTGGAKKRSSHKKSSHKKPSHKKPSPKRGGNVVSDLLTKQNGGSFAESKLVEVGSPRLDGDSFVDETENRNLDTESENQPSEVTVDNNIQQDPIKPWNKSDFIYTSCYW